MTERVLRLGAVGLGRAFTLMLPTFVMDRRVQLVAAADPREEARRTFVSEFGGAAYATVEELCADPAVEVIYVSSPHQMHAEHVCAAARAGKHVLVEKPMAITLDECRAMNEAARAAGTYLIVGHSHSFNRPIRRAGEIIRGGELGPVRMITALNYTDFMYRPRRPEELITEQGGGVVFSQGAHQIDIVRLLGGGRVRSVRASTGLWDASRPTEVAFSAMLTFESGAFASVTYSGYGHFDSDEFLGWIGEMGEPKDPQRYGTARKGLIGIASPEEEARLKNTRTFGGEGYKGVSTKPPHLYQNFGVVVASCDRGDVRPMPNGVMIYGDLEQKLDPLPPPVIPRAEVIDELYGAVALGQKPVHDGEWSLATLEVCLAIIRSGRENREIALMHQVPVN